MKELTPKQSRFYKRWSVQRKSRWSYILYRGPLHWAAIGFLIVLVEASLNTGSLSPTNFTLKVLFFAVLGIFASYNNFNINEKTFQSYLDLDKEIELGVALLEKEQPWIFENLTLLCEKKEMLTIRNNLFWLKEEAPSPVQMEAGLQSICSDFERLKENKKFNAFVATKKIKLELYNNENPTTPLATQLF